MYSKIKQFSLLVTVLLLSACGGSGEEGLEVKVDAGVELDDGANTLIAAKYSEFPPLPNSITHSVTLNGAMTEWLWEGSAGCFGTLTDGRQYVELHADADICESVSYKSGEDASVNVTYRAEDQLNTSSKMYSISEFVK